MNPTDVSWSPESHPDVTTLTGSYADKVFRGLSLSDQGRCLLDGDGVNGRVNGWSFYNVGCDHSLLCVPTTNHYPSKTELYVFKPDIIQGKLILL